jgi:hypothetical protein
MSGTWQPLGELGFKEADRRDVQPVEPDHGCDGIISAVRPLPVGMQHQIEGPHDGPFAVQGGKGAITLHHEAQGG